MSKWIKGVPPKMMHDKFGMYKGQWQPEMDRCWFREDGLCVCSRLIRTECGNVEHATLTRSMDEKEKGIYDISWAEKQQIKDELFGKNRVAIEVFPKEDRLVDMADVYHLWIFDKKFELPFGIHPKEYKKAINRGYSMSAEDLHTLQEFYELRETIKKEEQQNV